MLGALLTKRFVCGGSFVSKGSVFQAPVAGDDRVMRGCGRLAVRLRTSRREDLVGPQSCLGDDGVGNLVEGRQVLADRMIRLLTFYA